MSLTHECDTEWYVVFIPNLIKFVKNLPLFFRRAQYHGAANTTEPKGLTPFGRV